MSDIYLFDVDGTLTDAKCKIENSFADEFEAWMDNKEVYIVSGGSFERIIDHQHIILEGIQKGGPYIESIEDMEVVETLKAPLKIVESQNLYSDLSLNIAL